MTVRSGEWDGLPELLRGVQQENVELRRLREEARLEQQQKALEEEREAERYRELRRVKKGSRVLGPVRGKVLRISNGYASVACDSGRQVVYPVGELTVAVEEQVVRCGRCGFWRARRRWCRVCRLFRR